MKILPKSKLLHTAMICSSSLGVFPVEFVCKENGIGQLFYAIYSKTTFGFLITFILSTYIKLFATAFSDEIDFAEMSKNLIITPLFTITLIRQILIMTPSFKKNLLLILEHDQYMDEIDDKEVAEIDEKCAKDLNRNLKFYLGMMVVTECSYILRPLFEPENETHFDNKTIFLKQLPLSTWFPFDRRKHPTAAYLMQVVDIIVGSCYDTYGEFILIAVIVFPTGQLKILQHMLKNFDDYKNWIMKTYECGNGDIAALITLRECIRWHKDVIGYIEKFNDLMGTCMFLDFIQSSLHMACVLSETLTQQVNLIQLVSVAAYLIILNFRLFLYYYYANEVVLLSESLSTAIYQSNWYEQCHQVKNITFFLIMRSQKPLKYKLGMFGDMSLSKFISILNAAYSYVMLMCSFK